jgi:hypothetical protein
MPPLRTDPAGSSIARLYESFAIRRKEVAQIPRRERPVLCLHTATKKRVSGRDRQPMDGFRKIK